jgi:hypothetical protein
MASLQESVRLEVPHHIDHAGLVDDRTRVRLVADDQSLSLTMKKLPPRPGVLEHRVTKMLENRFELGPNADRTAAGSRTTAPRLSGAWTRITADRAE